METNGSRAVFDSIAPRYDAALPSHVQNYYREKRTRILKSFLRPGWICSVAGGTGVLEAGLQRAAMPVLLVDSSFGMCKVAKSRAIRAVVCADAVALPVKDHCVAL